MAVEVRIRFRHRGCYSERMPKAVRAVHVGGDERGCLTMVQGGSSRARQRVLADMAVSFRAPPAILETMGDRVLLRCPCATTGVLPRLMALGATILWPVVHAGGIESFRLVAPDERTLGVVMAFLRTNGEAEVAKVPRESTQLAGAGSVEDLVLQLSPRQREALELAMARGYYLQPRQARMEDLARAMGVSRSTFQEHLHKAERHAMGMLGRALARTDQPRKNPSATGTT